MGVVDRTEEFRQILRDLVNKGEYTLDNVDSRNPQEQSQMNVWSGEIGAEIHQAGLKVQELRKMAKKKDIFNDRTSDIQELTCRVKDDIQGLNKKIEALESRVNGQGPNRSVQAHSKNVVETLKTRLLEVTKDFKDALETRTKAMEKQQERRQIYTKSGGDPFSQRQQATPSGNPDDPEGGMPAMSQTQLYHNSRAQAVESVQRTIGELATMFQKMAVMVTAQEEMIQRIDHDVDDTLDNMNAAQDNLLKYFHHISSNRALIIKVFMILLFFVVFFIIFLA
mmetsp:Transcript_8250/g.14243  ORF Transcript_8250/g.14243 Transcript_8250/m.14243 type:complete len:281 (-) Transcript_8250:53-895(-)